MTNPRAPNRFAAGLLGVVVLALWPGAVSAQEPAAPPSLKLVAADTSFTLDAREVLCCPELGLWVTATGGDFRVDLKRPGYGAWEAAQVDAVTGATLRPIPRRLIAGLRGFRDFLTVRFLDRRGRTAGKRTVTFCPGEGDRLMERFGDEGPALPGFLGACTGEGFPFTVGMVWGLSRGWASQVVVESSGFAGIPRRILRRLSPRLRQRIRRLARREPRPLRLEPGLYRVVARINAPYRRLFALSGEDAAATLRVRVTGARRHRRRRHGASASRATTGRPRAAQTVENPPAATRPDLAALPPWDLGIRRSRRGGRDILTFASSPWNAGPAPLVVEGFRRPGAGVMDAYQYFFDAAGEVVGRSPAGVMAFHEAPQHNHWHFLQFVSYRLLRPDGRTAVRSRKQSFCITSTDPVDLTLPRADLSPEFRGITTSSCGSPRSIWIREALPAGWADTYGGSLPGQSVDITNVPNGRYLMEMHVNPNRELVEASTDNNLARRRLTLGGRPGRRTVRMARWQGLRQ